MKISNFKNFKEKYDLWIECLYGGDRNSIKNQILNMIWDAAVFRVINEARRIASPTKEGGVQLNGMVHRLIDHGFFEKQLSSIRKLIDKKPLAGREGVYSLMSLIQDMKQNANYLTRENLFKIAGLEYDDEIIRKKHDEYCQGKMEAGEKVYSIPIELNYRRIENKHKDIDSLAGVSKLKRSPNDTILLEIFEKLNDKILKTSHNIRIHVNKFIAHSAIPVSRQIVNADSINITLNHIYKVHEVMCKSANFINLKIFNEGNLFHLPIPQYNQFEYIDNPLVSTGKIDQLRKVWQKYEEETQSWGSWHLDEIL